MSEIRKHALALVVGLGLAMFGTGLAGAAESDSDESEYRGADKEGVVEAVDYGSRRLLINGLYHEVPLDADITVAERTGALSMILPGMRVRFVVEQVTDERRVIRQLDDVGAQSVELY